MIDHRRVEFGLRCPDEETFLAVMAALTQPLTGEPLAVVDEAGELITARDVIIAPVPPIVMTPGAYDEEGNEITPPTYVEGYHVNMYAVGELAGLLMPDPIGILRAMLGSTELVEGGPYDFEGYVGSSGIKVAHLSTTDSDRVRTTTGVIATQAMEMC